MLTEVAIKMALAAALGGIIGLEREFYKKPAGLRTNILICVGSTLFTIISLELARLFRADAARVAAQIVTGIGFIGAGAILRARGHVVGLTTAATVFVVAGVGMAVGAGLFAAAALASAIVVVTLLLIGFVERKWMPRARWLRYEASTYDPAEAVMAISELLSQYQLPMEQLRIRKEDDVYMVGFHIRAPAGLSEEITRRLAGDRSLLTIKRR